MIAPREADRTEHAGQRVSTRPLWQVRGETKTPVECHVISAASGMVAVRIIRDNVTYLEELCASADAAVARANTLRVGLVQKGWTEVRDDSDKPQLGRA
jgi:hypothetical protein